MMTHFSVDDLGPALWTDPCRDIIEDNQLTAHPKVLFDVSRLHGGTTDIAFPVIIEVRRCLWHSYSKAYVVMRSSFPVLLILQITAISRSSVAGPTTPGVRRGWKRERSGRCKPSPARV